MPHICTVPPLSLQLATLTSLAVGHTAQEPSMCRARFEWVDGALTRAIEHGQWVLLENANLCNPAVLDRLNSLLEPGGSLLLNEAGTVQGRARVLQPHADFRLFMTMDPR